MTIKDLYTEFLESTGVSTDTRTLVENDLFFALRGENFDGNIYVEKALEKGCRFVVCDDVKYLGWDRIWVVSSSLETLQDLAAYHRHMKDILVFAITGSNGKTTTKELVSNVLKTTHKVYATRGNLNNHIGVPLTLLALGDEDIAVVEMGANHPGEIARLCEIADPDAGLITNVGKAHLEGFGDLNGVKKAKGELFDYLAEKKRFVIVNKEDEILNDMVSERKMEAYTYGSSSQCDVQIEIGDSNPAISGSFIFGDKEYKISSVMSGAYNFNNIMAAVAVGLFYQVEPSLLVSAIAAYVPANNRSQRVQGKRNTLIMDAYNANPSSMMSALDNFLNGADEKKMLILGDMLELGNISEQEHRVILDYLVERDVKEVMLVGEHFFMLGKGDKYPFNFFESLESCIELLKTLNLSGYTVLLKGSRKISLERTKDFILN